jgi:predicted Na+-dependent transporter
MVRIFSFSDFCITIDYLSTFIGVNYLGYYEYNKITRFLISINDYFLILILDFIIMPLCVYGAYSLYKIIGLEKINKWIPYGLLVAYVPFLINNCYLIVIKL